MPGEYKMARVNNATADDFEESRKKAIEMLSSPTCRAMVVMVAEPYPATNRGIGDPVSATCLLSISSAETAEAFLQVMVDKMIPTLAKALGVAHTTGNYEEEKDETVVADSAELLGKLRK